MGDNCVASIYSHVNGMNNNKISKQETTNVFQRLKFLKSYSRSVLFLYRYRCDYVFISKTTYLFDLPFTYNDTCCKQLLIHIRISAFRFAFSFIWQRGLRSNENFEIYYLHSTSLLLPRVSSSQLRHVRYASGSCTDTRPSAKKLLHIWHSDNYSSTDWKNTELLRANNDPLSWGKKFSCI